MKILLASSIQKNPAILHLFLEHIAKLNIGDFLLDYCFIDDNLIEESSKLLHSFTNQHTNASILFTSTKEEKDVWDRGDHHWSLRKIDKIANYKNKLIQHALEHDYHYLFLVDSDLILHPNTLEQLIISDKEIIANIFWTRWDGHQEELPQVWQTDFYTFHQANMLIAKTPVQIAEEEKEFLDQLRKPGIYPVGGLGACTLIKREALEKGVNFSPIYNISFWGEDRAFCIRAAALGFTLYVDTHFPAYHMFRDSEISRVDEWLRQHNLSKKEAE